MNSNTLYLVDNHICTLCLISTGTKCSASHDERSEW